MDDVLDGVFDDVLVAVFDDFSLGLLKNSRRFLRASLYFLPPP